MCDGKPVHPDAVQRLRALWEDVRPIDVRLRARRDDLDLVTSRRHALGDLAAVLFGAARDHLAVTLHDVADAHRYTASSSASRISASGDVAASSATRRRPRATRSVRSGSLCTISTTASANNVGPGSGGSNNPASPIVSGIAP